jgi:hypothetical protein
MPASYVDQCRQILRYESQRKSVRVSLSLLATIRQFSRRSAADNVVIRRPIMHHEASDEDRLLPKFASCQVQAWRVAKMDSLVNSALGLL